MLDFITNNQEYELQSDNQLASILIQFDSDYAMNIVEDTLTAMFNRFDTVPKPNTIKAFKTIFKQLYNAYPYDQDQISAKEQETYLNIIDAVSKKYDFQFIRNDETTDFYPIADFIYDFYVAKFNQYIVNFFTRFIYEERENIYSALNMENLKYNKDASSNYNKLIFSKDPALITVAANLPLVLSFIKDMEVPDSTVYGYAYGMTNQEVINLFNKNIINNVSLFRRYNSLINNEVLRADIITHVRLKLQQDYVQALDPRVIEMMNK